VIANTDNDNKSLARLLVIDDDPDIVHVLKIDLIKYGFLVDAFIDPQNALQTFKSNSNNYNFKGFWRKEL
jgi:hypothetical protein